MELYKRSMFRDDWESGKKEAIYKRIEEMNRRRPFPANLDEMRQRDKMARRIANEVEQEFSSMYFKPKYKRDELLVEIAKRLNIELL